MYRNILSSMVLLPQPCHQQPHPPSCALGSKSAMAFPRRRIVAWGAWLDTSIGGRRQRRSPREGTTLDETGIIAAGRDSGDHSDSTAVSLT